MAENAQHEPQLPWSLIALTAPFVRQSSSSEFGAAFWRLLYNLKFDDKLALKPNSDLYSDGVSAEN